MFGDEFFVVKSIYFDKPEDPNWFVPYHQDLTISVDKKLDIEGFKSWTIKQNQFAVRPPIEILQDNFTIRIHLDNTNEENGALKVIPKSHHKGICRFENIALTTQSENVCRIKKGGIMLMKPLLLHSSSKTKNNHQRRVIHIEFSRSILPNNLNWSEFMIVQSSAKSTKLDILTQESQEQYFVLPNRYSWKEFKALSALIGDSRTIHLNYLDGTIEIMTTSAAHEIIVHLLSMLMGIYFAEMDIDFIPTGSATLESEAKGTSVEPDLSFCFGNKLGDRDLAIEVIFTSGNIAKLERYRRFNTKEVWFWEDGKFSLYRLREDGYETIAQSECLPNLDLALLARCLLMAEAKSALKAFRQGLSR